MLLSLLALLVACGGDTPKDTSAADTADTTDTGGTEDTSVTDTADTADTADTTDTSGGDTSDTGEPEPLPACDLLTPYRGCTADVVSDAGVTFVATWDADGRMTSEDFYTDATHTTRVRRTVYLYTDGRLSSVEYRDASDTVTGRLTYTYDAAGNLTQIYDGRFRTRYTYDAEGRMLTSTQETSSRPIFCSRTWTSTATGDDYEESCEGYRYTGSVDTRMLETLRVFYDQASGEEALVTTRVFRADCQPVSEIVDALRGTNDMNRQYSYDANGRLTEDVTDYMTGAPVQRTTRTYTCPA
jgi:YD repeat-containing protein